MENTTSSKCSDVKRHPQYLSEYLTAGWGGTLASSDLLALTFVFQGITGKPGDRGPKGERVCIILL